MELKFTSEPKYTLNCLEYDGLWSIYGDVITNAFEKVTSLPFKENVIEEAFGVDAAYERMAYEITFPELEIPQAWKSIMCYSQQERYKLWCDVLVQNCLSK